MLATDCECHLSMRFADNARCNKYQRRGEGILGSRNRLALEISGNYLFYGIVTWIRRLVSGFNISTWVSVCI